MMRCCLALLLVAAAASATKISFELHSTTHSDGGISSASFLSQGFPMEPGFVINTNEIDTPIPMPPGKLAFTSFDADIVTVSPSGQWIPTPLSEIYLHHWVIYSDHYQSAGCLAHIFGVGAESRNTPSRFPAGYGFLANGTEKYSANIHIIRTDYTPDVKSCVECYCGSGGGRIGCCPDGSQCAVTGVKNSASLAKTYYLRYTVNYTSHDSVIGVDTLLTDSTPCQIEFDVPQCSILASGCEHQLQGYYQVPYDVQVIYALGHLHIGGINITLLHIDTQSGYKMTPLCTSYAHYGNDPHMTAGNEKGYVVYINDCDLASQKIIVRKGDWLVTDSFYSSNPERGGVMALFYVALVPIGRAKADAVAAGASVEFRPYASFAAAMGHHTHNLH